MGRLLIDGIQEMVRRFKQLDIYLVAKLLHTIGTYVADINRHKLLCTKKIMIQICEVYF